MAGSGAFMWFMNCFKALGSGIDTDPYIPTVSTIVAGGGAYGSSITSKAGSITAATTAQLLMSANAIRLGWTIENNSSAANIYVGLTSATAIASGTSIRVTPGSYFPPGGSAYSTYTGAIYVASDIGSATFYAAEFN